MSGSWWTSVPKHTINRPNYTSHSLLAIQFYTRPAHRPEYSRRIRPLKSTVRRPLQCGLPAKSTQRVLFFLQKTGIDLAVCGTLWYVPRNAQSSPGGRRRRCRINVEVQMELCAGVHKRQNCTLGTRPLCLRSWDKRRLSARQSKSHSTCTPLPPSARGLSTHTYQKGLMATILVPIANEKEHLK